MSAIDQAQARLDDALDRLERAVAARQGAPGAADSPADLALRGEVEDLREECRTLRERLGAAETRHARLKGAMSSMGTRLDTAIAELDGLIEGRAAE